MDTSSSEKALRKFGKAAKKMSEDVRGTDAKVYYTTPSRDIAAFASAIKQLQKINRFESGLAKVYYTTPLKKYGYNNFKGSFRRKARDLTGFDGAGSVLRETLSEGDSAIKQLQKRNRFESGSATKQGLDGSLSEGGSATKQWLDRSLLEGDHATQQGLGTSLLEGASATKQVTDTNLLCRLKDIVCLLSSYSISNKGTGQMSYDWIQKVLKFIRQCRLKLIRGYSRGEFQIIDSEKFTLPPKVVEGIGVYIAYWLLSPSDAYEDTVAYGSLRVTSDLVDLAVESAIVQLKAHISVKRQESIHLTAITGEGAKKVISLLRDLVFIKDMFDLVLFVTISENENLDDLEKVIDRQWFDFPLANIILLLDDVHDMITLSKWSYLKTRYGGCRNKLKVVVTQLQRVNQPLLVDLEIRMEDHLVPWSVFSSNVGQILHTSTTIQAIAASIIKKCQGCLPALIVLARALSGIADQDVWEDALCHMHSPVAGCTAAATTTQEAIMINALKFSLSRKTCVTRQYLRNYIQIVSPHGLMISEEGDCIENDLVDAFLLHRCEDGEGVSRVTMEDEVRQILLRTSLLDVLEMLEDGESNALEIQLTSSDLSQLPQNPSCPLLTTMFLQMSNDLTLLSSSFFRYMPCLQILNLSNTSISSLPESLFQLSCLEKLYLRDCELFMELPSQIKELKNLKELDLERTALISLPKEVGDLENLTCLKVSFHGDLGLNGECPSETIIPAGILSKLSMLMNLCIDVNPADMRWDEAVEVVIRELSCLKRLKSLEMYLPEVALLDELRMSLPSFMQDSVTKFRLTVGRHQRRIMSRVPLGVEGQFGSLNKCLKYVNGNELKFNISSQVMDVLKHTDSFFLNRHFTITELAELGIENMGNLRCCVLGENDKLLTIIKEKDPYEGNSETPVLPLLERLITYRMKNMRSICEGSLEYGSLCHLKSLILKDCPQLKVVFSPELLVALRCLEELIVEDCPAISSLVLEVSNIEEAKVPSSQIRKHLRRLRNLSLHHLPELENIFGGLSMAPVLERMSIYDCPKLHCITKDVHSCLKIIRGEKHWFNALQWEDPFSRAAAFGTFVPIRRGSHFKTQLTADGFNF